MSERDPMVHIRMPAELRGSLQEKAREANRSMNAEIVLRLETSLSPYSPVPLLIAGSGDISGQEQELVGMWRSMDSEARRAFWILARRLADIEPTEI